MCFLLLTAACGRERLQGGTLTLRTVWSRSVVQVIGLLGFSVIVSGCFQTAGAQVQATMTPIGGVAVLPATSATPLQAVGTIDPNLALTLTASGAPPTAITLVAAQPTTSATATVAQLVFTTATGPATDTAVPSASAFPSDTALPSATVPSATPVTYTPTATPTVPTETPSITPTEPPIITPTLPVTATASGTSAIVALQGTVVALQATTAGLQATQTGTSQVIALQNTVIALQATTAAGFNSQAATQTQAAAFIQATGIIDTATAGAAQQATLVATLQGTGLPPQIQPTQPNQPTTPPDNGNNGAVAVTLTPSNAAPGAFDTGVVAGAQGTIDGNCRYTVIENDRLFRIALRFNMSTAQVAYPNRLINPDLIVPGEVIVIPGCNGTTTSPTNGGATGANTSGAGTASGSSYMVVDGDTLYSIATRYGVRVIALAQANGITNINLIYIGQNLTIPAR